MVDAADAPSPGDRVELGNEVVAVERATVERHGHAVLEADLDDGRRRRAPLAVRRPLEDLVGRLGPRILEDAGTRCCGPRGSRRRSTGMPWLTGNLDAVRGGVLELLGTSHVPVTNRRDDSQLRRERTDGDVEAHLVVALAGAAVRHRGGTLLARDIDEQLGDQRARQRGRERIDALVQRARGERRKAERSMKTRRASATWAPPRRSPARAAATASTSFYSPRSAVRVMTS